VVSGIHRDADGFHPSRQQEREKERKWMRKREIERSGSEREEGSSAMLPLLLLLLLLPPPPPPLLRARAFSYVPLCVPLASA